MMSFYRHLIQINWTLLLMGHEMCGHIYLRLIWDFKFGICNLAKLLHVCILHIYLSYFPSCMYRVLVLYVCVLCVCVCVGVWCMGVCFLPTTQCLLCDGDFDCVDRCSDLRKEPGSKNCT